MSGEWGIFCPGAGERDSVSGEWGIFCPGAGERDSVSSERGSSSGVSGDCDVLSWLPRLFSRKSSLGAESWSCCDTSQSACDELCEQGSAGMSMSSGCFGCVALSVSLWDSSTT